VIYTEQKALGEPSALRAEIGKVRDAAIAMAALGAPRKNEALKAIARSLLDNIDIIAKTNALDVEKAQKDGLPSQIIKRLQMDGKKVEAVAEGLSDLVELPDPVGRQLMATELDDGFILRKVACPIGVIGVIFESRPDALVQIAGLCLKSGNAVILKGGSEASNSNRLLAELIKEASAGAGLPGDWICRLETRAQINEILKMDEEIDLLIPRGSNSFVKYIMDNTRIPVLGHSEGLCHCYVDSAADVGLAVKVAVDSKTQYVAVCNAAETLLVHKDVAEAFLPAFRAGLAGAARASGAPATAVRGCEKTRRILRDCGVEPATDEDWRTEYLDYIISVKIMESLDEAIDHINRYGSRHTDAIVTGDAAAAGEFMLRVDSANVFHNCSTRFSDGFRYGFGAEVGVSTSKIHARGPVGLDGLVTYKYLLSGNGNIVADYEGGERKFTHKPLI